jgi:hypothetical protein
MRFIRESVFPEASKLFPVFGVESTVGNIHDQRDAKWIVIRGQFRGHNDTPFGRPTPGRPIGRLGVFGILRSYYQLVIRIFNIVPLISEFADSFRVSARHPYYQSPHDLPPKSLTDPLPLVLEQLFPPNHRFLHLH